MRNRFAIATVFLMAQCSPSSKPLSKELTLKTGTSEKKLTLPELKKRFGAETVAVDDYYLKRPMRYNALNLKKMLTAFAAEAPGYDEFIFRCADGYLAHVSRTDFEAGKLDSFYIAYGESTRGNQPDATKDGILAAEESGDNFRSNIPQGKAEVSPEPFYAVATDKAGFQTLSWPYELVAIELVNFKALFPKLYFAGLEGDKVAKAGFDLFRKECLKCHSLNLQGGDIGPELNIPKNITEYRDAAYLKSFIRNASSYRAKSKMPAFTGLADADISAIITYLKLMSSHKQAESKLSP